MGGQASVLALGGCAACALLAGCLSAPAPGGDGDAGVNAEVDAAPPCATLSVDGLVVDPASGHCYARFGPAVGWDDAQATCAELGGHLASFAGAAEERTVIDAFVSTGGAVWIGLRLDATSRWTWVTGEKLGLWNDWGPNQPTGPDEDCVELFAEVGECLDGCWNDLDCAAHARDFVCELDG